jgi:alpha-L-fucosidase
MSPTSSKPSRRNLLAVAATGATLARVPAAYAQETKTYAPPSDPTTSTVADRDRREQWWHQARFGMFIHFGLYSVLGRHEWAMEQEGIPVAEYEQLAKQFNPKPNAARAWAKLAKQAGMKYMVMTSKHHEGYCLFNTKLTDYCAPKQAAGRDLAAEFIEAARAEGLHCGFYYSLMDWHHPDGARCKTDEAARRRFVDYIHGQVRELCTNYGQIDVMWYDVNWPLTAEGWEAVKLNKMVRQLQPNILINNRSGIPEDFTTPEQEIRASSAPWEACMTMNDSWGFNRGDDDWKTPKTVVRNLLQCTRDGGNYLLNIGPHGDGTIPEQSVEVLSTVGKWMDQHAELIHKADPCQVKRSQLAAFTRQGNTLYVHVYAWPGDTFGIGGLKGKVLSAKMYPTQNAVKFSQDEFRVRFDGLPATAPDPLVSVIALEMDGVPEQDNLAVRVNRKRERV